MSERSCCSVYYIVPCSWFICMAIEAIRQSTSTEISGYRLRDVDILKELVVPNTADGVELQISLRSSSDRLPEAERWQEFHVYSVGDDDAWNEHCRGFISLMSVSNDAAMNSSFQDHTNACAKSINPKLVYQRLRKVGINHGPAELD